MNVLLGGGIAAQTTVGARILASYLYERRANKSVVNGNSYFVEGFEVCRLRQLYITDAAWQIAFLDMA